MAEPLFVEPGMRIISTTSFVNSISNTNIRAPQISDENRNIAWIPLPDLMKLGMYVMPREAVSTS
jgi:hypothetical protein